MISPPPAVYPTVLYVPIIVHAVASLPLCEQSYPISVAWASRKLQAFSGRSYDIAADPALQ